MPEEIINNENEVELVLEISNMEMVNPNDPHIVRIPEVSRWHLPNAYLSQSGVPDDVYEVDVYCARHNTFECQVCGERWPDVLDVEWVTRMGRSVSVCMPCDDNGGMTCENTYCGVRFDSDRAVIRGNGWGDCEYYCSESCAPDEEDEEEEEEEEEESDYYDGDRRSGRSVILPNGRPLIEHYHHTDEDDDNFCFTEYIPLPDVSDIDDSRFEVTNIKRHTLLVHRRVPDKFPAIGFELEKKIRDTSNRIEAAQFLLDGVRNNYLLLKEDATVNGWECVTYPADWRAHMELFPWDKLPVLGTKYGMYAWNDRDKNCGLHVHISRSAFRSSHLHRFMSFHDNHVSQLVKFAGRHNRTYAPLGRDYYDDRKLQALGLRGTNHSVGVNLGSTGSKTVELRYFRGSLKPETVKSVLQFTHALWLFTKDMTSNDVRYGANTFDKFVAFASENVAEYPDLFPRLIERGLTQVTS